MFCRFQQGIRSYYSQYSNEKLLCHGVRESLIPWICNFISNPHQSFKIDGFQSDRVSVNGGVPQGTKLGPVLFRVMINDMELRPANNNHWKYVSCILFPDHCCQCVHSDLSAYGKMRDLTELLSVKEFYVSPVILRAISWYDKNVLRLIYADCYYYDVFPSRVHG